MALEHYDSIDADSVFYNEQAYRFRETEANLFELKLAVINPVSFLRYPNEINTVEGILKNIDAICAVGARIKKFRFDEKNEFLSNFSMGMRKIYDDKFVDTKCRRKWISFSTTADFRNKENDIASCVDEFHFDPDPYIHVSRQDRVSYGAVYPLAMDDDIYDEFSENEDAAQRLEKACRGIPGLEEKYQNVLAVDPIDSLGKYVVWSSSLLIRKSLAKYCEDKPLHLIRKAKQENTYRSAKEYDRENNTLTSPRITAPLSRVADFVNLLQIMQYEKTQTAGLLGPKKLSKLIDGLQERHDKGIEQYHKNKRLEQERNQRKEFKALQNELQLTAHCQSPTAHPEVLAMMEENMHLENNFEAEEPKIVLHPALTKRTQTHHQMKVLKKIYKL